MLIQCPTSPFSHSVPGTAAAAEPGGYCEGRNSIPTKSRMPKYGGQELPSACEGQSQYSQPEYELQKALRLLQPIHFTLESAVRNVSP